MSLRKKIKKRGMLCKWFKSRERPLKMELPIWAQNHAVTLERLVGMAREHAHLLRYRRAALEQSEKMAASAQTAISNQNLVNCIQESVVQKPHPAIYLS
ncbi:hypothetical protein OUZ56_003461 [Daphnia magna]|uniref:Uncharacterized protein n=1 Tax=Daphnia magna TaxID=35525 RepID=A0ABR0A8X7_9CRUS|nr:hypothetical protein OUZ56_003461 [Daphnia magna]